MTTPVFLGNPPPSIKQWIIDHYGSKLDDPLCFTAVDAGATIAFNKAGSPDAASIVYATESSGQRAALDWQPYTFNTIVTLANVGDKVYFRAADENDISFFLNSLNYYRFSTTAGKKIAASGNIQTLMKADGSRLDISGKNYCYSYMFQGCSSLTSAPALPATTLADNCYRSMFYNCSSLTSAPALPATALANYCYQTMFFGCTSLTTAPSLPAMTLADYCYSSMFSNCTSLTTAPALLATALANYCYQTMFFGCTSLTTAPSLPATTLAQSCYDSMFYGCSSLTTAPSLPATTLAQSCYDSMFYGCSSLTTAPSLPAMTLADYCYSSMFSNCTSLTTAPTTLPAMTLADYCYQSMFYGCSSLATAPSLPAMTLADYCYSSMFSNCPNVQEITFNNLTCKYVVKHALEWGLGIDENYHKFLVVAYCSDGVVVINDNSGSSSDGRESATKVTYVDGTKKTFKIKGELTSSSIDNISNAKEVEIGNKVTSIGIEAFFDCQGLTSMTIPNSVTNIGDGAFSNAGLTSVTFSGKDKTTVQGMAHYSWYLSSGCVLHCTDGGITI